MASAKFPHVRLGHMLDEIDAIVSATKGIAAKAVMADYVTTRAVERAIQIVSARTVPSQLRSSRAGCFKLSGCRLFRDGGTLRRQRRFGMKAHAIVARLDAEIAPQGRQVGPHRF